MERKGERGEGAVRGFGQATCRVGIRQCIHVICIKIFTNDSLVGWEFDDA
jgi:hypothetical protein